MESLVFLGVHYSPGEVANFQSIAHRAVGSPSDAIFQDFITRSKTSDDVYIVLKEMGHAAGMKILKDYGKYAFLDCVELMFQLCID